MSHLDGQEKCSHRPCGYPGKSGSQISAAPTRQPAAVSVQVAGYRWGVLCWVQMKDQLQTKGTNRFSRSCWVCWSLLGSHRRDSVSVRMPHMEDERPMEVVSFPLGLTPSQSVPLVLSSLNSHPPTSNPFLFLCS
jgi:hypothetical protein